MSAIRMRKTDRDAARRCLALSDHEVIKAMEKKLIAEGLLPEEFGAERDNWRAKAKPARRAARVGKG